MSECIPFEKVKYYFVKLIHTELQFLIYITSLGCGLKSSKNCGYICYLCKY